MNKMEQVKKVVFCFMKYDRMGDKYYNKMMNNIDDSDIVLLQLNYVLNQRLAVRNMSGLEAKEHISNLVLDWTT